MPVLLTWPVSALLVWFGTWLIYVTLGSAGFVSPWPAVCAFAAGVMFSVLGSTRARQLALACGFPLSLVFTESTSVSFWAWLALLIMALLIYPIRSWRDAPLFPTPLNALRDVPPFAPLEDEARVLDAGCGLGDGLLALRHAYPRISYFGIEASWPLRALASIRCPWARIWQGDFWKESWRGYSMVYLFQRPEIMRRAVEKAQSELLPGAWLISLEFEAVDLKPTAVVQVSLDRSVWMYQQPFEFRDEVVQKPSQKTRHRKIP
jgi:hypothetical protein